MAASGRRRLVNGIEVVLWVGLAGLLALTVWNHVGERFSSAPAPDLPEYVPVFVFMDPPPTEGLPPPLLCPDGRQATMPPDIPPDIEVVDVDTGERYPDEEAFLRASGGPDYEGQGRYRPSPEALCEAYPTVDPITDAPPEGGVPEPGSVLDESP